MSLNLGIPDKSYSRNSLHTLNKISLNLGIPDKGYSRNSLHTLN